MKTAIEKAKNIKAFIFDVDGVLSDGKIILDDNGIESKNFDIKDGFAVWSLTPLGYKKAIITGSSSTLVEHRAKQLKMDYLFMGKLNKRQAYKDFKEQSSLRDEEICYIGDDLIDLPLLLQVGLSATPSNGVDEVKKRVDIVLSHKGGNGAVRELIELVLKAQHRYDDWINEYLDCDKSV